jgi:hypothetical protein
MAIDAAAGDSGGGEGGLDGFVWCGWSLPCLAVEETSWSGSAVGICRPRRAEGV